MGAHVEGSLLTNSLSSGTTDDNALLQVLLILCGGAALTISTLLYVQEQRLILEGERGRLRGPSGEEGGVSGAGEDKGGAETHSTRNESGEDEEVVGASVVTGAEDDLVKQRSPSEGGTSEKDGDEGQGENEKDYDGGGGGGGDDGKAEVDRGDPANAETAGTKGADSHDGNSDGRAASADGPDDLAVVAPPISEISSDVRESVHQDWEGKVHPAQDGAGEPKEKGLTTTETQQRLNELVEKSVQRKKKGRGQGASGNSVAFIKTHKTASTTLTAVLYRYGVRHGLRVARFDVEGTAVTLEHAARQTQKRGKPVDIFHYHHVWNAYFQSSWDKARSLFAEIMAGPASEIKYVTVLRDPVSHWLSYYYFYYEPETKTDVGTYFRSGGSEQRPLKNPLAGEFGIYNAQDLDTFIRDHLPTFALVMLTEDVDEGLVLLGKIMDWDLIDLTYASLLESKGEGFLRWDNKPVQRAPKEADLDEETRGNLARVTDLDERLYSAAVSYYAEVKERYRDGLQETLEEFRTLQSEVLAYLDSEPRASPARAWYMPESDYYYYSADSATWWKDDYPPPLPF